jgi:hypothetical protein
MLQSEERLVRPMRERPVLHHLRNQVEPRWPQLRQRRYDRNADPCVVARIVRSAWRSADHAALVVTVRDLNSSWPGSNPCASRAASICGVGIMLRANERAQVEASCCVLAVVEEKERQALPPVRLLAGRAP